MTINGYRQLRIHIVYFYLHLHNTEVTKSQRKRRRQRRLQIFQKIFTFEAWKIDVK